MRKFSLITIILVYSLGIYGWAESQEEPQVEPEVQLEVTPVQKIIPIGNVTLMGSYSKVCGGNNLSGLYASVNFAPAVRLNQRDYLIPLYSGLYKKQRQLVSEEEGARLYTTIMSHNFSLMHKHLFSELLTQRFTGFVSLNYNKETSDESFGDGLYDYRDYGIMGDYQYKLLQTETASGTLLLGGKYYFREYPNFQTLISLAAQTAPEEDEKDQHVFGFTGRYIYKSTDQLMLSLSYDLLLKNFTDKHTIDSSGVLEDKEREDNVHLFAANGSYRLGQNFILGLDGEIELNNSNQHYYDTLETTADLSDDVFVPHYFNYNKYEIRPSLTYLYPLTEEKRAVFKLSYSYALRDYSNRSVKDAQGSYKSELQEDKIHSAFFNASFPLTEKLSLLFNADYAHNISNMEYEKYYRYDYDIYHILSGFSYKF